MREMEGKGESTTSDQIAKVWSEVLQIENIREADNFFDLGGTSILAMKIFAMLEELIEIELIPGDIFDNAEFGLFVEIVKRKIVEQSQHEAGSIENGS